MNLESYPRHALAELAGPQRAITCEQAGLLDRLRDYSWVNSGIPADESFLIALAKTFGQSRYKFFKNWSVLEKFFTTSDGFLFYEADEEYREQAHEEAAKRRQNSTLAAGARWRKHDSTYQHAVKHPDASRMRVAFREPVENSGPKRASGGSGGGGSLPLEFTERKPPPPPSPAPETNDIEVQKIMQRAIDLGMAAPSWALAVRIRQKFSSIPISELLGFLVKWDGQEHAGLWDAKTEADFRLESGRQKTGVPRKPSQREEADRRILERARAADAQR